MSLSESHATVTYTSISSAERSWSIPGMDPYEEAALQAPEQAPPSLDYVLGLEYLKYLSPSDDEIPVEDQPLPSDASPTALSPGYVADSDLDEDLKEDPADYPIDGEDDEEEESSKDNDDDDDEEEEHLAPADSTLPAIDPVPLAEKTKPFETDESVATPPPPRSPQTIYASIPTPPLPLPSPLTLLSSLLPHIPSPSLPVPSPPLLLPSADCKSDIPKADMPFRKRLCLIAPAPRFEVGESSAVATARQTRLDFTYGSEYAFIDTLDTSIKDAEERSPTTLEDVDERVTDLATTLRQETDEMYVQHEDAQDDRAFLRAQINMLRRDRAQEARITSLEAQTMTLQTQHGRMEWQSDDIKYCYFYSIISYPLPLDTLSTFCPITAIHSLINTAYSLQLNTAYRSSETEAEFSCLISCLVFLSLFRTNPADIFTFVTGITSITVNGKNAYELKGKFLDDLHKNAFSGTNREDAVEHIKYFLKIVDPIDLPNVNQDKLKRSCFPNLIGALWDYWKLGINEVEPANKKTFDLEETDHDDEQEIEWPTCSWREDGYCDRGNLPGAYIVGNTFRYQDLELYDALKDNKLKKEALKNKAIMEGIIDDNDESSDDGWKRWDGYEITNHD
ncbi:hypothetical protein Tco_0954796 [Tanacetum coccineum]|uniref:Uncharacterized protein n=1 Tax=Tanacetum coccineum TaxID=301880 RepID=A0ABQ5E5D5_9ASTR